MSDDLVKRLRDWSEYDEGKINDAREEAADRIEALETALRHWACSCATVDHCKWSQINCPHFVARAAMERKNEQ